MRLYDAEISGNCYKPRLLLAQLGLEHETVRIDPTTWEGRPDALKTASHGPRVPMLELDDGRRIGESNAILCYLAEGTPYLPDDPVERAQVMQWLFFEQNQHEPSVANLRYWVSIARKPEKLGDALAIKQRQARRALELMEARLSEHPFLVGDRYTIADLALFAYTHVAGESGFDLSEFRGISRWLEAVRAQPGFVPMLRA